MLNLTEITFAALLTTRATLQEVERHHPALDLARSLEDHPAPPLEVLKAHNELVEAHGALARARDHFIMADFYGQRDRDD